MVNVKILGISCSTRHGNTDIMVKWALEGAAQLPGVKTEFLSLAGKRINNCIACYRCYEGEATLDNPCPGQQDDFNEVCLKMIEPDINGLIIGVYLDFQSANALWHNLKSRLVCLEAYPGGIETLRTLAFGACAQGDQPYGGQDFALLQVLAWAHQLDMYVVSCGPEPGKVSGGWLGAAGSACITPATAKALHRKVVESINTPEELTAIKQDVIAKRQSIALGRRVAETAKIIKAGYENVPREELAYAKGRLPGEGETVYPVVK